MGGSHVKSRCPPKKGNNFHRLIWSCIFPRSVITDQLSPVYQNKPGYSGTQGCCFFWLMPSQLNDPTVHFFWRLLAYHISDHQTKPDCCSELHISLTSQNCTLHLLARKFSSLWYAFPLPSMAPPYIVDCLHIWPLPRGRIYLGWHQCILAVRSFWFDMKKKC